MEGMGMIREQLVGVALSAMLGSLTGWIAHDISNLDVPRIPDARVIEDVPFRFDNAWYDCDVTVRDSGTVEVGECDEMREK